MTKESSPKQKVIEWLTQVGQFKLKKGAVELSTENSLDRLDAIKAVFPGHYTNFQTECEQALFRLVDLSIGVTRFHIFQCGHCGATSRFEDDQVKDAVTVLTDKGYVCPACNKRSEFRRQLLVDKYDLHKSCFKLVKRTFTDKLYDKLKEFFK